MTTTRQSALDAAIDLVGTEGLRSLTHARVDERAGLPKGSTSNYFRTRDSFRAAVVDRIVELEVPDVGSALAAATKDELVDALCGLIDVTTGAQRILSTARLVLFMEASHAPVIREALATGRIAMEAETVAVLERLGAADPRNAAAAIMACCEGIILHRIARHDTSDPRPALELIVRAAFH